MTTLKIYNHGQIKTVAINGLNENQYRSTYLKACDMFNDVSQDNVTMSWVDGKYYGYLICKGE